MGGIGDVVSHGGESFFGESTFRVSNQSLISRKTPVSSSTAIMRSRLEFISVVVYESDSTSFLVKFKTSWLLRCLVFNEVP